MDEPTRSGRKERESLRSEWRENEDDIEMYDQMLRIAEQFGHEYETERISNAIRESEGHRDDIIDRAVRAGLEPDEFDGSADGRPWACQDGDSDQGGDG